MIPVTTSRPAGLLRSPRSTLRFLALFAAGLGLVSLAGAASGVPSHDPTFREVETLLGASDAPLVDSDVGDGTTLPDPSPEPLLDQLGADIPCGTVIADAAARVLPRLSGDRRAEVSALLAPPRLATPQATPVSGENVLLVHDASTGSRHATSRRDSDRDGVPDAVESLQDDVRLALSRLRETLGWDGRFAGDGNVRILLAATPYAEGEWQGASTGTIVIPAQLRDGARLEAVTHQLAHAVLASIEPDLPPAFVEAAATWLGASVVPGDSSSLEPARSSRVLLSPGVKAARGDAALLHFLDTQQGLPAAWLGEVLAATARRLDADRGAGTAITRALARTRLLDALDGALHRQGRSLGGAVFEYMEWSLEQDLLAEGARAPVDSELGGLPSEEARAGRDLPPFGQLRFGLETPPVGGLRIAFEGDERAQAAALALLDDGSVRRFPLTGPDAARPDLALAGSRLVRIAVLVGAPDAPADWRPWDSDEEDAPGAFSLSASCDAAYPFLLASLSAATLPQQVTLEWNTGSEEDLRGWLVERALRPGGPFARLSVVPLPAQSEPQQPASYAFVDEGVQPSRRYHYRVVALTSSGLAEPSPVLTVRTLPEAMRRADD